MTTTKLIIELGDCSTITKVIFKFSNHPLNEIILEDSTWCDVWVKKLLVGKGELGGGTRTNGWVLANKLQYEIFTIENGFERVDELPDEFIGYVRKLYVYNITFTLTYESETNLTVELPLDFHGWMKKFHNKIYNNDDTDDLGVEIIVNKQ